MSCLVENPLALVIDFRHFWFEFLLETFWPDTYWLKHVWPKTFCLETFWANTILEISHSPPYFTVIYIVHAFVFDQ